MEYLVARGLARVRTARSPHDRPPDDHANQARRRPLQVFEKLPGFAGKTNVMEVTEKAGIEAAGLGPRKGPDDEKSLN
jgi:hypothetical protein